MTNQITITTAPCCWGVDDVKNPHLPHWEKVLDEAKAAGFGGLELGPYGYLPLDLKRVSQALNERGLKIVAGTIFDDLVSPENRRNLLRQTDEICALITRLPKPETHAGQRFPAPYLTVMDWGHDERDYAAGHSDRAPRLDGNAWNGMVENIRAIATLAREKYGVRATIHPHAGGYIEFADELQQIVEDIPADLAGLCLDTGHMAYSGMDPVATLRRYWDRVDYIHFKDIDAAVFDAVMGERIRFFDACAKGVMCPIGRGSIDYPTIRSLLTELGYGGYITIEQERDPRNAGGILDDLAASRAFLAENGF
ncbi:MULTISPECIES: sugar phosphate isomerase/epimerase family protein [Agrobacterium tumefaciens complex]|uniref:sugar phosphate isomerase/epimerase family protein n=1 Tax=Agrobacterium tumefaciens complex TaxID=1183400 RepID=UPI000DD4EC81|nr:MULTISPECIES: TIM barrel protein [Agrobacterium tumefaciens complex]MBB4406951.1 inosose dehydratase [Agrobacterium radiobacter]MBB4452845.1 inosose dehydratase [Agrobacterium radiobacter]MDP9872953.1 inosose dehydratase [Agrobacterium tumefaciens]MDP9978431.1 inosose dehydratase [Agrobacterium tumefaciens]